MENKKCTKCGLEKTLDEFSIKKRDPLTYESWCKDCKRSYVRSHYRANKEVYKKRASDFSKKKKAENKQKIVEYLQCHPCIDCGEPDVVVLQFDHVRGDKKACVTQLVHWSCCWETIQKEIDKCEVRCSNCHIRRTAKSRGWKYKY